ncbi:MAG: bifunctional (p)ppGpp synthetase/guanosine-3',5'-bis(diphosphate) 3'-pyrophosphohydrolase, partial [Alistipes sp.]|nr:bifunctional (p)ppGpp synthetase/guanosine-3',5'-bis(diphosphate) 3'-pyrophosphohydrolase [Alistipes sp.]
AAHWKYKKATISNDEDELDKWLKMIRTALESPTENAVEFLDNFKLSLYTDEIAIFTPKGEARHLPYGATAIDLAYDVHTKIGNSAIGAKINHKIMPITTTLTSGDQVEIITSESAKPKAEWLEYALTGKAKQAIKSFLKREQEHNYQRGMDTLNEHLAKLNITPNNRVIRKLMEAYESRNKEELYTKIGAGIVSLDNLEKVIKTNSNFKILKFWTLFIKDNDNDDEADDNTQHHKHPDKHAEHQELVVADCCHPLPGDSVVGYKDPITHQIIVHKATCEELNRLASQHGECIVKEAIQWSQLKTQSSLVTIEIVGIDRMGVLVDLANVVTNDFSINMRQVNIQSHDGIFEGTLSLYVRDANSLNAILERLRRIKGMDSVKRVKNP